MVRRSLTMYSGCYSIIVVERCFTERQQKILYRILLHFLGFVFSVVEFFKDAPKNVFCDPGLYIDG